MAKKYLLIITVLLLAVTLLLSSCSLFKRDKITETTTTTILEEPTTTIIQEETTTSTTITIPPKKQDDIEIVTDKLTGDIYNKGQKIEIKVKNKSPNPVTLTASNGCEQFFKVVNIETNEEIALYDKNSFCTQAIKELTINPEETKLIGTWDQTDYNFIDCSHYGCTPRKVPLGKYKIIVNDESKAITIVVYQTENSGY